MRLAGATESVSKLIGRCSNPGCRSAWLQIFRQHNRPIFEGGWTCSRECTEARLRAAVRRELDGLEQGREEYRHKIPLGLLMLENGWITASQLRLAVDAQREAGEGVRVGEWLVRMGATNEGLVAKTLSMQWGCPVLSGRNGFAVGRNWLPRVFVESFGALPLQGPAGRTLYLGFERSVVRALAYSAERVEGVPVECGIVESSEYRRLRRALVERDSLPIEVADAASDAAAAVVFAKSIERAQPVSSKLVRVHEWLWLRMLLRRAGGREAIGTYTSDALCRVGPIRN